MSTKSTPNPKLAPLVGTVRPALQVRSQTAPTPVLSRSSDQRKRSREEFENAKTALVRGDLQLEHAGHMLRRQGTTKPSHANQGTELPSMAMPWPQAGNFNHRKRLLELLAYPKRKKVYTCRRCGQAKLGHMCMADKLAAKIVQPRKWHALNLQTEQLTAQLPKPKQPQWPSQPPKPTWSCMPPIGPSFGGIVAVHTPSLAARKLPRPPYHLPPTSPAPTIRNAGLAGR
jgi:hypothetical protein